MSQYDPSIQICLHKKPFDNNHEKQLNSENEREWYYYLEKQKYLSYIQTKNKH